MTKRRFIYAFSVVALAACGGHKKVAAPASPPPSATTTLSSGTSEMKQASPSVAVSDEIAKACSFRLDDIEQAPKFDFDESDLLPGDREVLDRLGQCLTTGPLAGRSVRLVGRADPRGTIEYNLALGARRANAVAVYLKHLGVGGERLRETSRGELDATGTDEGSWQRDRRVDIVLAD